MSQILLLLLPLRIKMYSIISELLDIILNRLERILTMVYVVQRLDLSPKRCGLLSSTYKKMARVQNKPNSSIILNVYTISLLVLHEPFKTIL
jgi:hypothetical protein